MTKQQAMDLAWNALTTEEQNAIVTAKQNVAKAMIAAGLSLNTTNEGANLDTLQNAMGAYAAAMVAFTTAAANFCR